MFRRFSNLRLSVFFMLGAACFCFIPYIPGNSLYEGVGNATGKQLVRSTVWSDFVFENQELYLLSSQTWHAQLIVTYVRNVQWNTGDLQQLIKDHPEMAGVDLSKRNVGK
jgi:hypothetical protein